MTADLKSLEGCYLFYDRVKRELIRSGKASGDGPKANFGGRGTIHISNSKKMEEMMKHRLYQLFPSREVKNIGARRGYFENLDTYCAMAYDKSESVAPLCSRGERDSLFVWSDRTIKELERYAKDRGGGAIGLKKVQLDAVAYLWE